LLDLKGLKKPDQAPLIEVFQRKASNQTQLTNNPNLLPALDSSHFSPSAPSSSSSSAIIGGGTGGLPSNITTSLSSMATSAASNFNSASSPLTQTGWHSGNGSSPQAPSSPTSETQTKTGRLNENFRRLVMTGMAFRKDLQDRRDQYKD
jgi:hypothetical protein